MTGILTQALNNLTSEEQHIKALTGLPAAAQEVQKDSVILIGAIVTTITAAQSSGLSFRLNAAQQLDAVLTQIEAKAPQEQIVAALTAISDEAKPVISTIAEATKTLQTARDGVAGYANKLATIEGQLNNRKTVLVSRMNQAKSSASAAQKKRWYWLALGSFGIVGAAAALALFIKESSEASDLESQANSMRAQINRQNSLILASEQMGHEFVTLGSRIVNIENAANIVGADIKEALQDSESADSGMVLQLHVEAALTELATLAIDAA